MFWRRKKVLQPVAPETELVPPKQWFRWPKMNETVEVSYSDGQSIILEAFKIDWNNPSITFVRIL